MIHYVEDLQFQPTELLEFCLASKPNHNLSHLACVGIHNYHVGVFMERQVAWKGDAGHTFLFICVKPHINTPQGMGTCCAFAVLLKSNK